MGPDISCPSPAWQTCNQKTWGNLSEKMSVTKTTVYLPAWKKKLCALLDCLHHKVPVLPEYLSSGRIWPRQRDLKFSLHLESSPGDTNFVSPLHTLNAIQLCFPSVCKASAHGWNEKVGASKGKQVPCSLEQLGVCSKPACHSGSSATPCRPATTVLLAFLKLCSLSA